MGEVYSSWFQTHNVALIGDLADYVVSLNHGTIGTSGALDKVVDQAQLLQEVHEEVDALEKAEQDVVPAPDAKNGVDAGKLILAEEVEEGRISWDACTCVHPCVAQRRSITLGSIFFGNLGGNHSISFWTVFLGFLTLSQVLNSGQYVELAFFR